ncbi:MAG: peptidoglycan-binding domain-containing protein [Pseudorhodobacter sp.]|nr:peptidoglycan-binding domain-containing protein [Pseudorhodobacter sp.]
MKYSRIASGCLVAALTMTPAAPALARSGDVLGGLIVGGILGAAIANDVNRKKSGTTVYRYSTSSAQRMANREVQTALNYFGYPVGVADGSLGPKSRAAISQYQVLMGYPGSGQLTEFERSVLVTAYQRAQVGGPWVAQTIATHPMGLRGLLLMQRDEMAGIVPQGGTATPLPAAEAAPAPLPLLATEPGLPSFMGNGVTMVSLGSHCNKVSLLTNSNGGYTTAAAMTDANFALAEQFCLARTYAMATSEDLTAKVAGFTPQQIAEQCKGFGPALKDNVTALSIQPRDQVLPAVSAFVLESGQAPEQLAGAARVCLGVGYNTDAMDVAIGSALLLTALGEKAYAELLGHHLSQGFGVSVRPDLALDWYEMGLEATQAGTGIFVPGMPDRGNLIRKAAFTINGRSEVAVPAPLPVFAAEPEPQAAPAPVVVAAPVVPADTSPDAANINGATVVSFVSRLLNN